MICIIALIVFGILGIFSAAYRKLAGEAFNCVFRRITLRKCETEFDKKLKAQITGKLIKYPKAGKFVYKNFELLSWIFTILLIASFAYSVYSAYNYIQYGNCYGKSYGEGFCLFDPTGKSGFSTYSSNYSGEIIWPDIDDDPWLGEKDAKVTIIEFGCYGCSYTKRAEATIKEILKQYEGKVLYVYRDFPLNARHAEADLHSEAADCALEQGKYWQYHDLLFEHQRMANHTEDLKKLAESINLNMTQFNECFDSRGYKEEVQKDFEDGMKAGIYGTPTFFINNRTIMVGPKSFEDFKKVIDAELARTS